MNKIHTLFPIKSDFPNIPLIAPVEVSEPTKAVMVFAGENDVPGAGSGENIGPVIGIEEFRLEHGGEVVIVEIPAIVFSGFLRIRNKILRRRPPASRLQKQGYG